MAYRIAVITLSDKGAAGERRDESGPLIRRITEEQGYEVVSAEILPDGIEPLKGRLIEICDQYTADLILTTGGTGFSERDLTPEATLEAAERLAPGISEAMRLESLKITKRAMLSGSFCHKKAHADRQTFRAAAENSQRKSRMYSSHTLPTGLGILCGKESECGHPGK